MVVPEAWMPPAKMSRVHVHWTGGTHKANSVDVAHYHVLVEGDGKIVRGKPSIDLNAPPVRPGYAAHTLNANAGAIGISMCAMAGAVEAPFRAGSYPLTRAQWDKMILVVADLCKRYGIAVTPRTVLTHAEVQPNLGIKQRNKWDITRLAFEPARVGARAVGEKLRLEVAAALREATPATPPAPKTPSPETPQVDRPAWGVSLLRQLGWPRVAAIALIGNAQQESYLDLRTAAKGDPHLPGGSIGLFQWNDGSSGQFTRKTDFLTYCKAYGLDPLDFAANIRFADYELRTTEKTWGTLLAEAQTIYSACKWATSYLRPQGWSALYPQGGHGWANRLNNSIALDKRLP